MLVGNEKHLWSLTLIFRIMFSCWNDYLESPKHVSWFCAMVYVWCKLDYLKKKENHIKAKKWGAPTYVVYEMGLDMGWMSRGWTYESCMHALKANGLIFLVNSYNVEDNLEPNSSPIPLVIMTSEKTHDHIWDLLITNKFYGMKLEQIHLFKQVNTKFDFVAKGFFFFFFFFF
jgi:hypothetical protein